MIVLNPISDNWDEKFALHQRMANAIININIQRGECAQADLLALGFTKQETTELWHMANAMAAVELKLRDNYRLEMECVCVGQSDRGG